MSTPPPDLREARLTAIAGARAILEGDTEGVAVLVYESPDLVELTHAALGLAAALLAVTAPARGEQILAGLTAAALGPDGGRR